MTAGYEYRNDDNGHAPPPTREYPVLAPPIEQPDPPRVAFGPRPDDDMPHSWAARGLTWLKENRPNVFADMMLAIVDVERRPRNPK